MAELKHECIPHTKKKKFTQLGYSVLRFSSEMKSILPKYCELKELFILLLMYIKGCYVRFPLDYGCRKWNDCIAPPPTSL